MDGADSDRIPEAVARVRIALGTLADPADRARVLLKVMAAEGLAVAVLVARGVLSALGGASVAGRERKELQN